MTARVLIKDRVGHHHHSHSHHHQDPDQKNHQHHKNHFRENEIAPIPSHDLASRLTEGYLPTIVVDTRSDAINNGQIRGALICPEHSFGQEQIRCLMRKAKEKRRLHNTGISNHKCFVVFYSQGSMRSGLRCAHRFHQAVREQGQCSGINVLILRGGSDAWFQSFANNRRLVQDFGHETSNLQDICSDGK
jgi:3-mercaptopyruvate sulfurtransferase SseA